MGDRANIVVEHNLYSKKGKTQRIWIYGHWMGPRAINVAAEVCEEGMAPASQDYLTRAVFCTAIRQGHAYDSDTAALYDTLSYGISPEMGDNEYPVIVFTQDKKDGKAYIHVESQEDGWNTPFVAGPKVTPEQFVEAAREAGYKKHTRGEKFEYPDYDKLILAIRRISEEAKKEVAAE